MSRRIVHAVLFSLFGSFAIQCAHNMLLAQDADYIHKASGSAIFVYAPNTQPCAERQVGSNLLPSGSGFVIGIRQKGATAENWRGYKFLITAKHVIGNRTSIILRLNRKDTPEFTCYPLQLVRNRDKRNVLTPDRPEVDLIAVSIPNIPNTDPTVFENSMVLDEQQMAKLEVQVGTNVFAVGYLFRFRSFKSCRASALETRSPKQAGSSTPTLPLDRWGM